MSYNNNNPFSLVRFGDNDGNVHLYIVFRDNVSRFVKDGTAHYDAINNIITFNRAPPIDKDPDFIIVYNNTPPVGDVRIRIFPILPRVTANDSIEYPDERIRIRLIDNMRTEYNKNITSLKQRGPKMVEIKDDQIDEWTDAIIKLSNKTASDGDTKNKGGRRRSSSARKSSAKKRASRRKPRSAKKRATRRYRRRRA